MSFKNKGRKLGRKIRQITGLPLPVAMRAGALIVRGRTLELEHLPLFKGLVKAEMFPCGMECCGSRGPILRGPKGGFSAWSMDEV